MATLPKFGNVDDAYIVFDFRLLSFASSLTHAWRPQVLNSVSSWTVRGCNKARFYPVCSEDNRRQLSRNAKRLRAILAEYLRGHFKNDVLDELDGKLIESVGLLAESDQTDNRATLLANRFENCLARLRLPVVPETGTVTVTPPAADTSTPATATTVTAAVVNRQSDTKTDTVKNKAAKKRKLTKHEFACADRYKDARKEGVKVTLGQVINDYLAETPDANRTASTIERTMQEHREIYSE